MTASLATANRNEDIWARICQVDFDIPGASFPLSTRLARDNGWSQEFADRTLEEYRKFAFIAVTAGREVTPSDEVDQAWHLHLLYTRHYWGEWAKALGTGLHHGPTRGGVAEGQRYDGNYRATLALLEEYFDQPPPADIWPSPEERFRDPGRFKRLDTSKYIILNRFWRPRTR